MSLEMKRKRPAWVSWVPTAIVALAIIGVGATSAALINAGVGQPPKDPTTREATDDNLTLFTSEGVEYIEKVRRVRINLADGQILDAAALGLPEEGELVIGPTPTELDIEVEVYGGGEGSQGFSLPTQQFSIATEDGELASIAIPLRQIDNFRETLAILDKRAATFGWDVSDHSDIIEQAEAAQRAQEGFSFTIGPASRLGMDVSAVVDCDVNTFCSTTYVVSPADAR